MVDRLQVQDPHRPGCVNDQVPDLAGELGLNVGFSLAGFFGSLFHVKGLSRFDAMLTVVAGTMSANYLTPLVVDVVHVPERGHFACAFFIGTLGLRSVEFCMGWVRRRLKAKG